MPQTLYEVLTEALEDEYKARATYQRVIERFGEVRPFANIAQAEDRHVRALLPLFGKYGIPVPEDSWARWAKAPGSLLEASQEGVMAEIDNAAMYRRLLAATRDYPDVQQVLRNLRRASQENHLPAFQRAVQRYSGTLAQRSMTGTHIPDHTLGQGSGVVTSEMNTGHTNPQGHGGGCGMGGHGWGGPGGGGRWAGGKGRW